MLEPMIGVFSPSYRSVPGRFGKSVFGPGGPAAIRRVCAALLAMILWLALVDFAAAHHVLGRPSYSLSEDSNTPPSMTVETRIGDYFVTYMVFPAFPKPGKPGRINLYARRIDDGTPFQGEVAFKVHDGSWFSWLGIGSESHTLGLRPPDDNVFRQGFLFEKAGDYVISTEFEAAGEPYVIDFPLRIGEPPLLGPIGVAVGGLLIVLAAVNVVQRRRSMTGKIRGAHEGKGKA